MKPAEGSRLTPELVARYPRPGMAIPGKIHYSPDAKLITYLFSERGDLVRELWALDLASGRKQRWLAPPGETVTEETVSREEKLRRERLRLRETGITDYIWAEKANVMLLPIRGELYRWVEGSETRLTGGGVIDPKITADGRRTFFVRDGDVWTIDDAGERRLTLHPDGRLLVQWLSRDWQHLEILAYDVGTGAGRGIVVEKQEPWINLHHDLRVIESTGEFTWSSERTGFRHLYLYAPDGRLIRQLTSGAWPAEATVALDENR